MDHGEARLSCNDAPWERGKECVSECSVSRHPVDTGRQLDTPGDAPGGHEDGPQEPFHASVNTRRRILRTLA